MDAGNIKLKNCPFCGGRARVIKFSQVNGYRIVCGACGCASPTAHIQPWHDNKFVAQCQAAKSWNRRV